METYNLSEGEDIFYLAHVLSFLIHDTSAENLSLYMKLHKNKFAMRKLRAVLSMLEKVFGF